MHILRGLGFTPVVNSSIVTRGGESAGVYDPDLAKAIPEGACTSDGKLRWSYTIIPTGAWHVVAPDETCSQITNIDSGPILSGASNQKVYVGAFPLDVNATQTSTVTVIEEPGQISPAMRTWLALAANKALDSWKAKYPDRYKELPASLLCTPPKLKSPTIITSGKDEHGLPIHFTTWTDGSKGPWAFKWRTACDWLNALEPGLANKWYQMYGGLMTTSWLRQHYIVKGLGSDPKTPGTGYGVMALKQMFERYSIEGWAGFEINKDAFPFPLAKFIHPITGDEWGMWASLNLDTDIDGPNECPTWGDGIVGHYTNPNCITSIPLSKATKDVSLVPASAFEGGSQLGHWTYLPGTWNPGPDRPVSYHLEIGFSKVEHNSFVYGLMQGIIWLPSQILNVAEDVIDAIKNLVCSDPAAAAKLAGNDPRLQIALAAARALCPAPQTTCPDGSIAPPGATCLVPCKDGSLVPMGQPCPTPWYLQWYTLVLAAGAVAVGAVHLARKPKAAPRGA